MASLDLYSLGARIADTYLPFLFALCFHEFAHGWVARLRGDNTAEMMGRLTLNPTAHADILGTYVLPLISLVFASPIFFGWAKPVPVNTRNLKKPKSDLFWIALAGPMSNILLAICAAFAWALAGRFLGGTGYMEATRTILSSFLIINLFLAVFNLIPIHPLDGGKILARFIPNSWNYWLEQNESTMSIVLMILMLSGVLGILVYPVRFGALFLKSFALQLVGGF